MGNGATRSLERVAAAMGELESAPIEFQATCDVAQGGVLLALPALLASGLLRCTPEFYQLPKGFYGIESIQLAANIHFDYSFVLLVRKLCLALIVRGCGLCPAPQDRFPITDAEGVLRAFAGRTQTDPKDPEMRQTPHR